MGDMGERGGYAGDQTVKEEEEDDDDAGGKGRVFFSVKKKKKSSKKAKPSKKSFQDGASPTSNSNANALPLGGDLAIAKC